MKPLFCSQKSTLLFHVYTCLLTITGSLAQVDSSLAQTFELNSSKQEQNGLSQDTNQADVLSMVASIGSNNGEGIVEFGSSGQSWAHANERRANKESTIKQIKKKKFDWNIKLDKSGYYKLNWRVVDHLNRVTFSLCLNKQHFKVGSDVFALGFSERGELTKSSDFCVLWYDLGHRLHLQTAQTSTDNKLQLIGDDGDSVCELVSASSETKAKSEDDNDKLEESDDELNNYVDHKQLAENERSETTNNELEIVFRRPLDACHAKRKYYTIDEGTTHLVWFKLDGPVLELDGLDLSAALGVGHDERLRRPPIDHHMANNDYNSHLSSSSSSESFPSAESGLKLVQLVAAGKRASDMGSHGAIAPPRLDIRMDKYEIPASETTYWCKLFKLPHKFQARRYHITSFEALIEPAANEQVVHHMELFNCANLSPNQALELDQLYEKQWGWSGECGSPRRPNVTQACKRVILAWAMGARPLVYPDEVGQSIGGPNYSPYVVLEIHYNNVDKRAGLLDSSGLRFHYRAKLRPFDAGVLEVGLEYSDKNSIPPKMLAPLVGYCAGECTRAAMSATAFGSSYKHAVENQQRRARSSLATAADGIYIFAAQMHTHLTGVASWTEIVRGGKLIGELQRDNHYSAHFQEIRLLPKPVRLLPGDSLLHYCLYDTSKRTNVTLGGFATTDEMCVTYLHYYPRIDLEVCKSSVDTRALEQYFARLASEEGQPTSSRLRETGTNGGHHNRTHQEAKSVADNYRSIEWSARRSRELLDFYARAPLSIQCNRSNGERWPGEWNGIGPTKVFWLQDSANNGSARLISGSEHPAAADFVCGSSANCGATPVVAAQYRGFGQARRHAQCARISQAHSAGALVV